MQRKTTTTKMGVEQACPPGKYARRRRDDDACESTHCCLWPPDLDERSHLKMNVPEISLLENPLMDDSNCSCDGGGPYKIFSDESSTVENAQSEDFLGDLIVEVHVVDDPAMKEENTHVDLAGHRKPNTPRNFSFQKMPWREMIRRIRKGEKLYMRHTNGPKKAANVLTDFQDPETKCNPFDTPTFHGRCRETGRMVERFSAAAQNNSGTVETHSSVLRVSSPGTTLWMHFDTRDNILHQLNGRKRVILYAPECEPWLNVEGSSARLKYMRGYEKFDEKIINEISCDEELEYNYRLFDDIRLERAYVCTLEPGDALYIPALWFHRVTSLPSETNEPSVAVNVFYNRVDIDYDAKDVYGNKDLVKGKDAMQKASELGAMLNTLPPPYRTFYARRCLNEIAAQLNMYLRIPDPLPSSHPPRDNTGDDNKEALKAFED